jgi:hypothetical protein
VSVPAAQSGGRSTKADGASLARLRGYLVLLLAFSMLGTAAELVLGKHYDTVWKALPLALFGLALLCLAATLRWPRRGTLQAFRGIMVLFIISGGAGTLLHYQGKREFALERNRSLKGMALLREAVFKGANPPLLAPGSLIALGLLGLLGMFRHPTSEAD